MNMKRMTRTLLRAVLAVSLLISPAFFAGGAHAAQAFDVSIQAVDSAGGRELEGAYICILEGKESLEDFYSTIQPYETLLTPGEYTLKVTVAPDGYLIPGEITFALDSDGRLTSTGSVTEDDIMLVEFEKTGVDILATEGDEAVEDATLQVLDPDGNVVEEWVSGSASHKIEGLLTGTKYKIVFTVVPQGSETPEPVSFTISGTGEVSVEGPAEVEDGVIYISMEQEYTYVTALYVTVEEPAVGETPASSAGVTCEPEEGLPENAEVGLCWYEGDTDDLEDASPMSSDVFEAGKYYFACPEKPYIGSLIVSGYKIADSPAAFVNGEESSRGQKYFKVFGPLEESAVEGPEMFAVSVEGGTADKAEAAEGETVNITADEAEEGFTFSGWTVVSGGVSLDDAEAEEASFTMPAEDVSLKAVFEEIASEEPVQPQPAILYKISVDGGKADKDEAEEGEEVSLTADSRSGYRFSKWSVASGPAVEFKNASKSSTVFTMPAGDVSIKAEFKERSTGGTSSSGSSQPAETEQFKDVPKDAYYHDPVYWAVGKGVTEGTSNTTFSPMSPATRADFVTFLWRAAGKPEVEADCPFEDIEEGAYYYKAVLWAYQKGITEGTTPTTFRPDLTVTRGQAVTFLWRNAGKPGAEAENPFTDVEETEYYYQPVLWAVANGITEGTAPDTFSPARDSFRAEVVTMIYRQLAK